MLYRVADGRHRKWIDCGGVFETVLDAAKIWAETKADLPATIPILSRICGPWTKPRSGPGYVPSTSR